MENVCTFGVHVGFFLLLCIPKALSVQSFATRALTTDFILKVKNVIIPYLIHHRLMTKYEGTEICLKCNISTILHI